MGGVWKSEYCLFEDFKRRPNTGKQPSNFCYKSNKSIKNIHSPATAPTASDNNSHNLTYHETSVSPCTPYVNRCQTQSSNPFPPTHPAQLPVFHLAACLQQQQQISKVLRLDPEFFTCYEFGPAANSTCAIEIRNLNLNFLQLEQIILENRKLLERNQRIKQLIKTTQEERSSMSMDADLESLMRKAKKLKEVKEENKKLRRLLQQDCTIKNAIPNKMLIRVQLQNTERIREETQKTMTNLKDEFDALVREMQRGGHGGPQAHSQAGVGGAGMLGMTGRGNDYRFQQHLM